MVGVVDTEVCKVCGEEYWYSFEFPTGYTKLTACKCDRFVTDVEDFLKEKGLWEEFLRFHEEREKKLQKELYDEDE